MLRVSNKERGGSESRHAQVVARPIDHLSLDSKSPTERTDAEYVVKGVYMKNQTNLCARRDGTGHREMVIQLAWITSVNQK